MVYRLEKHKIWVARFLLFIYLFSVLFGFKSEASQSGMLGESAALGSPLVSNTFTVENWNVWEMLCFGIFLSNFCQPFEDDYNSAFTEGASIGSQGRGLKALQFAAGGDATAAGYLADMVNYCKEAQGQPYKPIYVNYNYYEYDTNVNSNSGTLRRAYMDDLFPQLIDYSSHESDLTILPNTSIVSPVIAYTQIQSSYDMNNLQRTIAEKAILPTFYADVQKADSMIIFDMTENWDIQILKSLFTKAFNKYAASDYAEAESESDDPVDIATKLNEPLRKYLGQTCPLVMDTFGNICMQYNNRMVVVIPAASNQHLTAKKSYNFVNSLVLNNFVMTGSETEGKLVSFGESTDSVYKLFGGDKISVGNFPVGHSKGIKDGRLLITSDTDTVFMREIYKKLKEGGSSTSSSDYAITDTVANERSWSANRYNHGTAASIDLQEYNMGKLFSNLLDQKSIDNQALQIHITGADCFIQESTGMLFWKTLRDQSEITIDTALGGYGILSNMFALDAEGKTILDYFYVYDAAKTLEDTRTNLFDGSFYLTPTISHSNSSAKMYVNYYCHMMAGDNTYTINPSLQNLYTNNYRDVLYNNLRNQDTPGDLWATMLSTQDVKQTRDPSTAIGVSSYDNSQLPANLFFKSFVAQYWKKRDNGYSETDFIREDLKVGEVPALFDSNTPLVDSLEITWIPNQLTEWDAPTRLVKVYKPSGGFSTLAGIFGLDEGCQFELYSTYIYVTYLEFYGLMGSNNSHGFNEELFKDGGFKTFTGDNFKNGLTKEQMEDQVKLNTFKLLALTKEGEQYRASLFKSLIKTSIVEPLDKAMNKGGVGNVGAETRFLDIARIEDNFLFGDLVKNHWGNISIFLFGFLSVIAIVSGALNNKTIGWYLTILIASSSMVYSIPFYLNLAPVLIEKYINNHFMNTGGYWALAESVEYDKNHVDMAASGLEENIAAAMLNTLKFLDTDSSLMIKLDISQKVVSVTALDYNKLQQMTTTRWLLPSLMKQMSSRPDNFDYVSVPVTRLYDNFASIWVMYHGESDYMPSGRGGTDADSIAVHTNIMDLSTKQSVWAGVNGKGYRSTAPSTFGASSSTKSVSRVIESEKEPTHTCFYLLKDGPVMSAYDVLGESGGLSRSQWNEYASKVVTHNVNTSEGTFRNISSNILNELNTWNTYTTPIKQSFGYLWTTENLGTYFYTLVKDTFGESGEGSGKNLASVMMQLQGSTATNAEGKEVRTSFMHFAETGYERDVCDMEEVFTNVLPYMYQMMLMANGKSNDTTGLLGKSKMDGNPYYANNYQSWMFRSNWVTKIYEDNLYAGSATLNVRDENGAIIDHVTVKNMSDPRSYPESRPMVFSEAQMHQQNLKLEDLSFTERKILDFNKGVVRRWTTLLNYANTNGLNKEHIYRQMAMDALFEFNQTFTRDNIIMNAKTMYPTNFDLRKISLITIIRSLVCNVTSSNSYMYGDVAVTLYDNYGFFMGFIPLWIIYHMFLFFGLVRDTYMILALFSTLATLILNFATTSQAKFKSMGGCMITSGLFTILTIGYYMLINMMVGNPTVDTMVNFSTIASTRMASITFMGTGLVVLVLTLLYTAIIVMYFYELWIGHKFGLNIKDGGFGFYYQVADRASKAIIGATEKVGSRIKSGFSKLGSFGPGADKNSPSPSPGPGSDNTTTESSGKSKGGKGDMKITNDDQNPVPVKVVRGGKNGSGGSFVQSMDINENFTSNITAGENRGLTDDINSHINESKKKASYENANSVEISETMSRNNVDIANVMQNTDKNTERDDAFAKEVEQRINSN